MGQPEFGAGFQPAGEMVVFRVEKNRFPRHRFELLFERAQIRGAAYFTAVRHTENELAETEVLDHELPDFLQQQRRGLDRERHTQLGRFAGEINRVGLQQNRNVEVRGADSFSQPNPGVWILLAFARKFDVRDDAQYAVLVVLVVIPGFFVRAAQEDFGAGAHPQQLVRHVHPLGEQALVMLEHLGIDGRQVGGIEIDVVFHQDDRLHPDQAGIFFEVHLVFDELDNRDQDAEIPLPDEDSFENSAIGGIQFTEFTLVERQQHDRHPQLRFARPPHQFGGPHIGQVERGDYQVERLAAGQRFKSFLAARNPRDTRRVAEVEVDILRDDLFVKVAVFFEDKRIVEAGNHQDFPHPETHQVLEFVKWPDIAVGLKQFFEFVGNHLFSASAVAARTARPPQLWIIQNGVALSHPVLGRYMIGRQIRRHPDPSWHPRPSGNRRCWRR